MIDYCLKFKIGLVSFLAYVLQKKGVNSARENNDIKTHEIKKDLSLQMSY